MSRHHVETMRGRLVLHDDRIDPIDEHIAHTDERLETMNSDLATLDEQLDWIDDHLRCGL